MKKYKERYILFKMRHGYWITISVIALLSLIPAIVFAESAVTQTFGDLADKVQGQGESFAKLLFTVGVAAGIGFVVGGLVTMFKASKGRGEATWGRGWSYVFIGVALTSLSGFITTGSVTLWGVDQTEADLSAFGLK